MQPKNQHELDVRLDEPQDDSSAPSRLRFKDLFVRNDETLYDPSRGSLAYSTMPVSKKQQHPAFWQLTMPNSPANNVGSVDT